MNVFIPYFICLGLVVVQLLLAKLLAGRCPRVFAWCGMLAAIIMVHFVTLSEASLVRMVLLCSVLMAGMKWIVYREWCVAKGLELNWMRWVLFGGFWFGMDLASFHVKRRKCEWKSHGVIGASCVLVGLILWYLCFYFEVENIVLLFVPMSLAFHFGILRLLTTFWRIQGFAVRVLFKNPLKMRGFADFWGKRWNLAYSEMMARTVKQPLQKVLGEKASVFAVFLVSGLLHEIAITVPVQAGYGLPTLFFLVHGILTLVEKKQTIYSAVACAVVLIVGLPCLFNPTFKNEVIIPSRDIFKLIE